MATQASVIQALEQHLFLTTQELYDFVSCSSFPLNRLLRKGLIAGGYSGKAYYWLPKNKDNLPSWLQAAKTLTGQTSTAESAETNIGADRLKTFLEQVRPGLPAPNPVVPNDKPVTKKKAKPDKTCYKVKRFPHDWYMVSLPNKQCKELGITRGCTLTVQIGSDGSLCYKKVEATKTFKVVKPSNSETLMISIPKTYAEQQGLMQGTKLQATPWDEGIKYDLIM